MRVQNAVNQNAVNNLTGNSLKGKGKTSHFAVTTPRSYKV